MTSSATVGSAHPQRALRFSLWVAQAFLGVPFIVVGLIKLLTPIPKLAAMFPWTGQLPELFVRFIGMVDITGGVGLLLPALTRIKPGLVVWAAAGCSVLQLFAIIFHTSRGEIAVTPLNFWLLGLAAFIAWGRGKAPIRPRA